MRTKDYENVIADLDGRIAELEAENAKLEAENNRLRETLHKIYSEACFILNSEDDVDSWGFVKSTRDTALQEGD